MTEEETCNSLNGLWKTGTIKLLRYAHKILSILMTQEKDTMSSGKLSSFPENEFLLI